MPAPKQQRAKLGPEEAREMQHLTKELKELLDKIAKIVHSETGAKTASFNVATVIVQSDGNPLQVGFRHSTLLNVHENQANREADPEIGYYIDPPGVCTTVPACIPY
jgi:hypothetical protein